MIGLKDARNKEGCISSSVADSRDIIPLSRAVPIQRKCPPTSKISMYSSIAAIGGSGIRAQYFPDLNAGVHNKPSLQALSQLFTQLGASSPSCWLFQFVRNDSKKTRDSLVFTSSLLKGMSSPMPSLPLHRRASYTSLNADLSKECGQESGIKRRRIELSAS